MISSVMFSSNILSVLRTTRFTTHRSIFMSTALCSASQSPLFKLRQKTGLAYNLCREALNKHENDIEQAEIWLKAQALAHGLQKATKMRDRNAREGLIGLAVRSHHNLVTIMELNCETDFVAKNQLFKDFAVDLTGQLAATVDDCEIFNMPDQDHVKKLLIPRDRLQSFENQIAPLIMKLGENIKLQRAIHFKINNNDLRIFGQVHAAAGSRESDDVDIMTGRFGAIVALQDQSETKNCQNLSPAVGNRLCRHVIGYSPTYIELPDAIRAQLEATEKERQDFIRAESKGSADDDLVEAEEHEGAPNTRDDWPSIMDQQLILSEGQTVRSFCEERKMSIVYFNRFECGEIC